LLINFNRCARYSCILSAAYEKKEYYNKIIDELSSYFVRIVHKKLLNQVYPRLEFRSFVCHNVRATLPTSSSRITRCPVIFRKYETYDIAFQRLSPMLTDWAKIDEQRGPAVDPRGT
jgi:hypothetical protein